MASSKQCYFPRNLKKGDCACIQSFCSHGSFEYHFANVLVRQQPVCQCSPTLNASSPTLKQVFLVDIMAKLQNTGPLLATYQTSRHVWLVCSYTHIKYSSFFYPLPSQILNAPQRHIPNCTQHKGFRQNTDPRSTDPLVTPLLTPIVTRYKINGRVKIKKCPELSM